MKNLRITVNGKSYDVQVEEIGTSAAQPIAPVPAQTPAAAPTPSAAPTASSADIAGAEKLTSPMPGNIIDIKVSAGDSVKSGQPLVVLEAMKMENEISAPRDCEIVAVHVSKGAAVESGALLVSYK